MNDHSTPTPSDPTASIDAVDWHRRPCDVGDRIVVSGDLSMDEAVAVATVRRWRNDGITGVVDCRGEWSDEALVRRLAPEIGYCHVGIDDDGSPRPDSWFDEGTAGALDLLERTDGRVIIHCHMGINRGPSMAFAVLLCLGRDHLDALDAIRSARPIAALIYAEDAVSWWARRNGLTDAAVAAMCQDVRDWHRDNGIDVWYAMRQIHSAS